MHHLNAKYYEYVLFIFMLSFQLMPGSARILIQYSYIYLAVSAAFSFYSHRLNVPCFCFHHRLLCLFFVVYLGSVFCYFLFVLCFLLFKIVMVSCFFLHWVSLLLYNFFLISFPFLKYTTMSF